MATRRERAQPPTASPTPTARTHERFGWSVLFLAMLFGLLLEAALGFKVEGLLLDELRRDFWSLAHFHAALLALLNLVYARWAESEGLEPAQRRRASRALLVGSTLVPLGFFLGGLLHPEGDPGVGIVLVPLGALGLLYAIGVQALASWRG